MQVDHINFILYRFMAVLFLGETDHYNHKRLNRGSLSCFEGLVDRDAVMHVAERRAGCGTSPSGAGGKAATGCALPIGGTPAAFATTSACSETWVYAPQVDGGCGSCHGADEGRAHGRLALAWGTRRPAREVLAWTNVATCSSYPGSKRSSGSQCRRCFA